LLILSRSIAAASPFPGLRRFPEGRDFKQWTGDDSKALMKVVLVLLRHCCISLLNNYEVYLAAITGLVPSDMVKCLAALLDFIYIARQNAIDEDDLDKMESALERFHEHRQVFSREGVCDDIILLPRQHSLVHYVCNIRLFGAPNGLGSLITEAKHIVAVKKPWRRSSHYMALSQMPQRASILPSVACWTARHSPTQHVSSQERSMSL
jgi:hypothetical protein